MDSCRSRIILLTIVFVLAAAVLLPTTAALAADAGKVERTVTVSATGRVTAEPDVAHISAGVVTEAESAKAAIARNNAVMAKVIDGLKDAGVDPKDMRTTALDVGPRYTQPKDGRAPAVRGYRVSNKVRLTVRDVERLGETLDRAIALGANQIDRIAFDVADAETLTDEARRRAMVNARRRGELYAKAAGAQLGPVLRISEGVTHPPPRATTFGMARAVPIEPGTRSLEVQVSVVYALR